MPGKRGSIALLEIACSETVCETRSQMFKMITSFNAARPKIPYTDGESRSLWAGPSKTARVRQECSLVADCIHVIRSLCPDTEVENDHGKQQLRIGDELAAMRTPGSSELTIRPAVLQQAKPDLTQAQINTAKIKQQEEKQRRQDGE